MKIPTSLLRETVAIEPFLGDTAYGPKYGASVALKVRWEGKRRLVRKPGGPDIISSASAFTRPEATVTLQSRVTRGDRVYQVVDVLDGEGLTSLAYQELVLA